MIRMRPFPFLLALTLTFLQAGETLLGSGATFPANAYAEWIKEYEKSTQNRVSYLSIGSGGGIKQIKSGVVDFGASEEPLKESELAVGFHQFPSLRGSIALVYNLPSLKDGELRLTPELISDIYLGLITHWQDPKIRALNPNIPLPNLPITPLHRNDGSGTTLAFTSYMDHQSKAWSESIGKGKALAWPKGMGAKGNAGMSQLISQKEGSLGYVELSYKLQEKLSAALLPLSSDLKEWLSPVDVEKGYPLITTSYIIFPLKSKKAREVVHFFDYSFKQGDATLRRLGFIPLNQEEKGLIQKRWQELGLL